MYLCLSSDSIFPLSVLLTVPHYVLDEARRISATKKVAVIKFLTTVAGKGNRNLPDFYCAKSAAACSNLINYKELVGSSLTQYYICTAELLIQIVRLMS